MELPSDIDEPDDERTIVAIRVPDQAFRREMERKVRLAERSKSQVVTDDAMRWVLGKAIQGIKNVRVIGEDGQEKPFVIEREGDQLTQVCYQELTPIVGELINLIVQSGRVTARERKNSLSPSP